MKRFFLLLTASAALLAGCSGGNRNEREADKITRAVIANDMAPVVSDFDPAIKGQITRIRVAELSDEMSDQGAYQGLKENDGSCPAGYVCFDVKFAKRTYYEKMKVESGGKVRYWWIQSSLPR